MFRYTAFLWKPEIPAQNELVLRCMDTLRRHARSWRTAYSTDGLTVLCCDTYAAGMRPYILDGKAGVVLGTVFRRSETDAPAAHATFTDVESARVVATSGRHLVSAYWGDYVAFLVDNKRESVKVIKDPTGSLPCLCTETRGVYVLFSSIDDLLNLKIAHPAINWPYIAKYLVGGSSLTEGSALIGVDEVNRGECVEMDRRSTKIIDRKQYWMPSTFTSRESSIDSPRVAEHLLHQTVLQSTRSWATCHEKKIVRLSGGLDSSIVAGCLGKPPYANPGSITCLTLFGTTPGANPTRWASLAAKHSHLTLVQKPVNASSIKLDPLLAAIPTPAPGSLHSSYLDSILIRDLLLETAATGIFTGDGGDSGFGRLSAGRSVDESMRRRGLSPKTLRLAAQIAAARDSTGLQVLIQATKRVLLGTSLRDNSKTLELLGQMVPKHVRSEVISNSRLGHPWLRDLNGAPWELAYRLGTLLLPCEFYDPFSSSERHEAMKVQPLYAQPVLEACLRTPLETHFLDGVDRGLARLAFKDEVPPEILQRQWKDMNGNVAAELIVGNSDFLRDLLLDGELVQQGLLERRAIDLALSPTPSKAPVNLPTVMHCMNTELWVRRWKSIVTAPLMNGHSSTPAVSSEHSRLASL